MDWNGSKWKTDRQGGRTEPVSSAESAIPPIASPPLILPPLYFAAEGPQSVNRKGLTGMPGTLRTKPSREETHSTSYDPQRQEFDSLCSALQACSPRRAALSISTNDSE
ncbi:hypothetical protein THAOC_37921, partial [Thalassiosira oceanica]